MSGPMPDNTHAQNKYRACRARCLTWSCTIAKKLRNDGVRCRARYLTIFMFWKMISCMSGVITDMAMQNCEMSGPRYMDLLK